MAQPWNTIKGGGSSTLDPARRAEATKARVRARAPRLLGWGRSEAQIRWARRFEIISVFAIGLLVAGGLVGVLGLGVEPWGLYGVAAVAGLVTVHPIAFLADTLSGGDGRLAGWCIVAYWALLIWFPVVAVLLEAVRAR